MTIDVRFAESLAATATEPVELLGTPRTPVRLPVLAVPYVIVDITRRLEWITS